MGPRKDPAERSLWGEEEQGSGTSGFAAQIPSAADFVTTMRGIQSHSRRAAAPSSTPAETSVFLLCTVVFRVL